MIIKLINNIAQTVNNDPIVADRLKVVYLENYRWIRNLTFPLPACCCWFLVEVLNLENIACLCTLQDRTRSSYVLFALFVGNKRRGAFGFTVFQFLCEVEFNARCSVFSFSRSNSAMSNRNVLIWAKNNVTIFMRAAHWMAYFHFSKPKFSIELLKAFAY